MTEARPLSQGGLLFFPPDTQMPTTTPTLYRRMVVLAIMGACHLMFVWSGDILLLYALMEMLLPLFYDILGIGNCFKVC